MKCHDIPALRFECAQDVLPFLSFCQRLHKNKDSLVHTSDLCFERLRGLSGMGQRGRGGRGHTEAPQPGNLQLCELFTGARKSRNSRLELSLIYSRDTVCSLLNGT